MQDHSTIGFVSGEACLPDMSFCCVFTWSLLSVYKERERERERDLVPLSLSLEHKS